MIKVITDKDSLLAFKDEWDALYAIDPDATPFQKFEYIVAEVNCLVELKGHKNLNIICIKDSPANKWVAIFPFILTTEGNLEFINAIHSDFCLPLINPAFNNYNIYKELSDWLLLNKDINGLNLLNLKADSSLLSVLKPHFKFQITYDVNQYSSIPVYKKDSDRDVIDSIRYVQATKRKNLRKSLSKINPDTEFKIFSNRENKAYPKDLINELIACMVGNGIRTSKYFSEEMLLFWEELYENDVLILATISENKEPKSCHFMFYDEKKNEYIMWIILYSDPSWNLKINLLIAQHIYDNGGGTINFARGIYDYKLVNFHPDVKPLFCVRIAKTRRRHLRNLLAVGFHYLKPVIMSIIRR